VQQKVVTTKNEIIKQKTALLKTGEKIIDKEQYNKHCLEINSMYACKIAVKNCVWVMLLYTTHQFTSFYVKNEGSLQ
jgi:hypothetical protein